MTKIDTSSWGEFRIGDMFDVSYGKFIAKKEADENANIPHITASGVNNGISYNVSEAMFPANCLTVASDGAIGATYYQDTPFSASNIVSVLVPHTGIDLSKYVALFICTAIKAASRKYSWGGFKFSVDRVRNTTILLPQTPDHTPDFDYMENYMKEITKLAAKRVEKLKGEKPQTKIDTSNWKRFEVGELFDVANGKKYPSSIRQTGELPLISTTANNNGISDYIKDRNDGVYSNCITVAYSGSVGATFYHKEKVFVGETVIALLPKFKMNQYSGLFICSILSKINSKFSYTQKIKVLQYKNEAISLPVTPEGTPDFDYMENYMKNLTEKAKNKIKEVKNYVEDD